MQHSDLRPLESCATSSTHMRGGLGTEEGLMNLVWRRSTELIGAERRSLSSTNLRVCGAIKKLLLRYRRTHAFVLIRLQILGDKSLRAAYACVMRYNQQIMPLCKTAVIPCQETASECHFIKMSTFWELISEGEKNLHYHLTLIYRLQDVFPRLSDGRHFVPRLLASLYWPSVTIKWRLTIIWGRNTTCSDPTTKIAWHVYAFSPLLKGNWGSFQSAEYT